MNIAIKSTNYEIAQKTQEYLERKIVNVCEKFTNEEREKIVCEAELAQDPKHHSGNIYSAEVNLEIDGNLYRATAQEETMSAAIDKVKDELTNELRKSKKKKIDHVRKGGAKAKDMLHQL